MRVLIVEDDPDINVLLQSWFRSEPGIEIRLRTSAEDITEDDIMWCEAAIVDQCLPGVSGCEALTYLAHRRPGIKLILWTAQADLQDCGAAHHVVLKPSRLSQLMEALYD